MDRKTRIVAGLVGASGLALGGCGVAKKVAFLLVSEDEGGSALHEPADATQGGGDAVEEARVLAAPTGPDVLTEFDPVFPSRADALEEDLREASAPSVFSQMSPVRSANVTQVTFAHDGAVFDPTVTPDGETVVFASTQHSVTSDLYVKSMHSRVQTRLTSDPANDAMPAISPDGRRIAFCSDRGGNWDIYVMPIEGGRPLVVSSSPAHEIHPSWSPDGSKIVFNRRGQVSGRWEMWVVDADDSTTAQFIGYGLFPEFCPQAGRGVNGSDRIVFQQGREVGSRAFSIWTLDYDGRNATRLTEIVSAGDAALINPSWSPDGRRILFASVARDGSWSLLAKRPPSEASLWMVDVDGTDLVRLTSGDAVDLMPAWAGTDHVIFASDRDGRDNLWSLDLRGAMQLADYGEGEGSSYAGAEESSEDGEN